MGDLWTEDPRLAALYDTACAGRHDHDFYLDLAANLDVASVTDLGCGTGVFAVDVARSGVVSVGIDPAQPMLDIARERPDGDRVTWVQGSAADAESGSADLVVMMGHVAQYFVDDPIWATTLSQVHRMLVDGGHVTFEVRNPLRPWAQRWNRQDTTHSHGHPDGGECVRWVEVLAKHGTADSYQMTHQGNTVLPDGQHLQTSETLRYRSPTEIFDSLAAANFDVISTWGDWDGTPHTAASEELIVLARRS